MSRLENLKAELEAIYSVMPETFEQQKHRDKVAFIVSREIELLENPKRYQENLNHWEGHEIHL